MDAIATRVNEILFQPIDNPTIEDFAAALLTVLPDEKQNLTPDQQRYWERSRELNKYAASYWIWQSHPIGSNPIKDWKKGSQLDRYLYDSISGLVHEMRALLNLIAETHDDISEALQQMRSHSGYESCLDLFAAIVTKDENQLLNQNLQPYSEFFLGKAAKNHDLLRRSTSSLKQSEIKHLKQLAKTQPVNDLKIFALQVCKIKAYDDPSIAELFRSYQNRVTLNHDLKRRICSAASKDKISELYSYVVQNGVEKRVGRGCKIT